jgi:hypothetical protein
LISFLWWPCMERVRFVGILDEIQIWILDL